MTQGNDANTGETDMDSTTQAPNWFAFIETRGKRLRVGWFLNYANAEQAAIVAKARHNASGAFVVDWRDAGSLAISGEA